jgi:mRNA interferase MazF
MTTCDRFDVVVVPFPFIDARAKLRPAVVVSARAFNIAHGASVLAMVTTAARSQWSSDVAIGDRAAAGLPAPSVVRLKLFTLENDLIARRIGTLGDGDRARVADAFAACLGQA